MTHINKILQTIMIMLALIGLSISGFAQGTWITKTSMPTVRQHAPTVMIDNKIYVTAGDLGSDVNVSNATEVYDPSTDTWETKANIPAVGSARSGCAFNDKIYVFGGFRYGNIATVNEYNTMSDTWSTKSNMPTARHNTTVTVYDGKIYVIGGNKNSYSYTPADENEVYDPTADTWETKANLPIPILGAVAVTLNNKIYLFGEMNNQTPAYYKTTYMYDPITDIWTSKSDMLKERHQFSAVVIDGKIYAIGGDETEPKTIEVYNSDTDTWSFVTNLPTDRYKCMSANIENQIYVIGGSFEGSFVGTNELFTLGHSMETDATYGQLNTSNEIPVTATSELTADNGIYSYQFNYAFDNTKLEYTGYDLTGLISESVTVEVNTDTPGELAISWMRATPLVGTGDLINLQFNAIAEGTSDLTITNFKYNETDVTDVTNGDITIVIPTTADVTYSTATILPRTELVITATFNRAINDSPVAQIELNGANTLTAINMTKVSETVYTYTHTVTAGEGIVNVGLLTGIDEYGFEITYTPTTGATFEILSLTYGDVTDNGEVTAFDAALTLMYSVGVDPMPEIAPLPWDLWRVLTADVDGSDDITATDAGLILQFSVGLIDIFPVENGDKSGQTKESDIIIEIVDNEFVFTTQDELLGFNLYVTNNSNAILGEPEFLDPNMLSATQIEGETYNVGTCIPISPASGTQILKIPFTGELTGELIFNMKVNNTDKSVTFGTTGIAETNTKGISVYPNPATDKIQILSSVSLDNSTIEIYTISGKLVNNISANDNNEINISNLSKGIYIIKINSETVNFVEKFIKE